MSKKKFIKNCSKVGGDYYSPISKNDAYLKNQSFTDISNAPSLSLSLRLPTFEDRPKYKKSIHGQTTIDLINTYRIFEFSDRTCQSGRPEPVEENSQHVNPYVCVFRKPLGFGISIFVFSLYVSIIFCTYRTGLNLDFWTYVNRVIALRKVRGPRKQRRHWKFLTVWRSRPDNHHPPRYRYQKYINI